MSLDKKGMSLVELIVTLALMVLFIGCTIAVIVPVLNVYNKTINMADDQSVAMNIADTISHKVNYGRHINVSEDGKTLVIDGVQYTTQDGYLKEGDYLVFDTEYYKGAKCNISFEYINSIVNLNITIFREMRDSYNYQLKTKPLYYINESDSGGS